MNLGCVVKVFVSRKRSVEKQCAIRARASQIVGAEMSEVAIYIYLS